MNAIKVDFYNEREEKVLLSFLESLEYDYEPQYTDLAKQTINILLDESINDSAEGRVFDHEKVMADFRDRYGSSL